MSEKAAKVLLAAVVLARSSSFVLSKIQLNAMDVFNLMGIRFILAFLIMLIIFNKRLRSADRSSVTAGLIIGIIYFIVMTFEVFSLKTCDSSTTAFLENTAIAIVPLFEVLFFRKKLLKKTVISFLMAMTGVALLTLQGAAFSLTIGHILALLAAFTYAGGIIITDRLAKKADALVIGIVQLGTMGVLSAISSFLVEDPFIPNDHMTWLAIILLALVCSCFGFTLQPVAQKYISTETSSLFCAFSPLGAGILGCICLNETLSPAALAGAALVICSILVAQKKS